MFEENGVVKIIFDKNKHRNRCLVVCSKYPECLNHGGGNIDCSHIGLHHQLRDNNCRPGCCNHTGTENGNVTCDKINLNIIKRIKEELNS